MTPTTTTTCTIGPSATTGERCGQPAVWTFGDEGQFGECAAHSTEHIGQPKVDETVQIRRYGRIYTGRVVKRGSRGAVYAEITYDNGVKRTVRV